MRPLLVVFTYGGQQGMIERHMRYWEKTEADILFSFPVDSSVSQGGLAFEASCHHGVPIMRRIFRTFEHVLKLKYDTYFFTEGDSIALRKCPTKLEYGLHGFLWDNTDPNFKASRYPHYAHGMNRSTLVQLNECSKKYNPGIEQGFQDRVIGRICEENDISMHHRPDLCYSRNRLDAPQYVNEARAAISQGATFIHGIKTEQELESIL